MSSIRRSPTVTPRSTNTTLSAICSRSASTWLRDHGGTCRGQLAKHVSQLHAAVGIEPGGGLVEQQHTRSVDQCPDEAQSLFLTPGQHVHRSICVLLKSRQRQELLRPGRGARAQAVGGTGEPEVLAGGEVVVDAEGVGHPTQCRPHRVGLGGGSCPAILTVPASGSSSVARIRSNVVLPAPLGPTSPVTSPCRAVESTPRSASTGPKLLLMPSATTPSADGGEPMNGCSAIGWTTTGSPLCWRQGRIMNGAGQPPIVGGVRRLPLARPLPGRAFSQTESAGRILGGSF